MNLILAKILKEKDLDIWSRLKTQYFSPPYSNIYSLISKFYDKYGELPSFEDLEVSVRDKKSLSSIRALKEVEVPDIDSDILVDALINEYAQEIALDNIEKLVDSIAFKDSIEIVEDLSALAYHIEDQTESSEQIVFMNDYITTDEKELLARVPLGLSNDFDQFSMGMALSEFVMIGGFRGTGKSVICSNIACNQYTSGNSSLYFSIEMRGREIFERNLAILSEIPAKKLRSGNLTDEEKWRVAQVRAGMVKDNAPDLLEEFKEHKDLTKFENELKKRPINPTNQLITIDNPRLTLSNIDATMANFKNRLGDNLTVVVVDYINQISEKDAYDWKVQIEIAKKMKELARKYEVVMVAPYQTDEEGKAKFSRGLLIPPDWAFKLEAHKAGATSDRDSILFSCEKSRNDAPFHFESPIDWNILKIRPNTNLYAMDKLESSIGEPKKLKPSSDDLLL